MRHRPTRTLVLLAAVAGGLGLTAAPAASTAPADNPGGSGARVWLTGRYLMLDEPRDPWPRPA